MMMKKIIIILILALTLVPVSKAADDNAVSFSLKLIQADSMHNNQFVVYSDTISILLNQTTTGYIGPFSIDLDLVSFDTIKTNFYVHLVSTGPAVKTMSKNFTVEYSLPAQIDNLMGKTGNPYQLTIRPLQSVFYDTTYCSYNHRSEGTYLSEPTAYTDIFYVVDSYGDFYWDAVKELMETEYRRFKDFALYSLPGKYSIYLCPCDVPTIIWDKRFGTMIDPTRSSAYTIYSKEVNTADPFIISQLSILKNFGYAPPFLSEGLAGYFSFAPFDMKEILKNKSNLPLKSLLETNSFLSADPMLSDRTAATFVRYLVDKYGLNKFMTLYKSADDVNLESQLMIVYNKSIAEFEEEWHQFVNEFKFNSKDFNDQLFKADLMFNFELNKKLSIGYLNNSTTLPDSLNAMAHLKRAYFFTGDYKKAVKYQEQILLRDSSVALNWMGLGSFNLMAGNYQTAISQFDQAFKLDSTNSIIRFNKALGFITAGDSVSALTYFRNNLTQGKVAEEQVQSQIMAALIMKNSSDEKNKSEAQLILSKASNTLKQALQQNNASPALYLWLAVAEQSLGNFDEALQLLDVAEFLENRPFYQGMIYLWKGKTYLSKNQTAQAKEALEIVTNIKAADYHLKEANKLLKKL